MEILKRILHLEDEPADAELAQAKLDEAGLSYRITRVQTREEFNEALGRDGYDIILADYRLPAYDGISALRLAQKRCPDIPFIFVSGTMGEEAAIEALTQGATDYVLKQNLLRLASAIQRALHEAENLGARRRAEVALKESEEKYRSMMEAMDDAAYICSPNYRIEYLNSAMIKRIGRDATGEPCYQAMHGGDEKCPGCVHEKVMDGESLKTEVVSSIDQRIYSISHSPILHTDGSVSKLAIFRDITEIKKMATRLDQAQRMEAIGTLAGGIAHDFNNILFPIIGMSELLMEDLPAGSHHHDYAAQIFKSGRRAQDLVKQILSFSRQGKHKKVPVGIQHILKEAIKLTRATIPSSIEITQSIQSDCGLVMADPTQLHQIAMNLITNAYHAVEEGGGTLSVQLKETLVSDEDLPCISLDAGKYAVLSVSDTGCGIAPAVMGKIFEPYFTTKEVGKGTGLGLSVVYGIVKDHGGDIRVYSELGIGTTFNVYLPLLKDIEKAKAPDEPILYETGTERILLVDDEEVIVHLEQMMLEKLGYQVTPHTSSLEALVAFKAKPHSFDLVITDMTMPNMTGDKLAGELKSIAPDIPIIVCTGFSAGIDEKKAMSMGVNGFLMKPIVKSDMARIVRNVLDEGKT